MDIQLTRFMRGKLENTQTLFHRYMFSRIHWNRQMFGLVGPRGVGKTTMFLQYIKEHYDERRMFYVTADHVYFSTHSLLELADEFSREGGQQLFIDEIHKYANWSRELKQIYDSYPDMMVAFTGSSILDITKGEADLSRRAPIYQIQGLSFREYLSLYKKIEMPVYTLDDILNHKAEIHGVPHPLPLFSDYLKQGYYPFAGDPEFEMLLHQSVTQTMEVDIPQYANMNPSTGRKLKKLLSVIAQSVPFKPVMDSLATIIGVSRNVLPDYFLFMEKAGMIGQLRDSTGGVRGIGKVEKVYLDNTNLAYLLAEESTDIGNIRETFFYNQMRVTTDVISSRISDFEIGGKTFEVGGKKKGKKQIESAQEGYLVRDDIEYGTDNIIPLWAFGLTY
ncbi:MAG: AAA family ATPase [Prevotella sp.]|nr:AAA family ATPase [Prevotella sp.]